ncbi:MAG: methionyl-tRNA formyltransferase [Alphaproteobacteria bacterium]|nr:methionyl-tRNA formyltransferase [Alphaproteobacteria bacterium]
MALRLVFMGTPAFSVPCLRQIVAAGHDIVAVYTQPPRPAGRGMEERKSPVHVVAQSQRLHVETPVTFKSGDAQKKFLSLEADAAVVVAYGLLLPQSIVSGTKLGCFNLHASKLPRWRGAAPIQRAIMSGDAVTAATVMRMDEGLDTGPICLEHRVAIDPNMTAGDLHDHIATCGADLMVEALAELEKGTLPEHPQSAAGVTYARKLEKSEARMDFDRPADTVHNHVRGLSPFPGAWFEVRDPSGSLNRIKVLESRVAGSRELAGLGFGGDDSAKAPLSPPGTVLDEGLTIACATGALRLLKVQRAGRRVATAAEFLRGFNMPKGTIVSG